MTTDLDVLRFSGKARASATAPDEVEEVRRFIRQNLALPIEVKGVSVSVVLGGHVTVVAEMDREKAVAALDDLIATWERQDMATQAEAARASGIPLTRINQAIKDGRLPYYVVPSANPRRGRRVVSMAEVYTLWPKDECEV